MKKKNTYIRLYDFCLPADVDKPVKGRRPMYREERVPIGLGIPSVLVIIFIFLTINNGFDIRFLIIMSLGVIMFLYMSKVGVISLYYLSKIKNIEKSSNRTVLEEIILQANYEHNKLNLSQENFHRLKNSFSWLIITLIFRDKKYLNYYRFKITRNGIKLTLKLSKKYKELLYQKRVTLPFEEEYFNLEYFNKCKSIMELQKEILSIYIERRDKIFELLNDDLS